MTCGASRKALRWHTAAVFVASASRHVLISAICSSTSESASDGEGGGGVPSALTGGLVLTVVRGVNNW
jgi:hypothetical protein